MSRLKEGFVYLAMAVPLAVAASISGVYVSDYLNDLERDVAFVPGVVYDQPGFGNVTGNVSIRLSNAPYYDVESFGTGTPFVIVTYLHRGGHLENVKTYAEVTMRSTNGVDLCQTKMTFEDFYIAAPANGATNRTTNVTYASESYQVPLVDNLPGGQQCGMRAGTQAVYDIHLCAEIDGVLDLPRRSENGTTFVDDWDLCLETTQVGEVPSWAWPYDPMTRFSPLCECLNRTP